MKKYFSISVGKYSAEKNYELYCSCTLDKPRDNAVTFITESHLNRWNVFERCSSCLIFWPESSDVPTSLYEHNHVLVKCPNPHLRYCQFFEENGITYIPQEVDVDFVDGSWISKEARIGVNTTIMPGAYVGNEVVIGNHCYIGCGVKLVGEIQIGDNVIIRENTVIGADGLTTDRDSSGKPVRMPQFGGVRIGNNVSIGANTVIARGAIDDTVIDDWTSIDNSAFISHNVHIGKRVFVVGETIMFGSSTVGDDSFVSGNSSIRNGVRIGEGVLIGMGSVVVKDIEEGKTVKGNPAK